MAARSEGSEVWTGAWVRAESIKGEKRRTEGTGVEDTENSPTPELIHSWC